MLASFDTLGGVGLGWGEVGLIVYDAEIVEKWFLIEVFAFIWNDEETNCSRT